jgi:citrate lyase subunit beta/citryl-CoA lyase
LPIIWLGTREAVTLVRVNPLGGHLTAADVASIMPAGPDAIMLPKSEGATSILQLDTMLRSESARDALLPAILPIATEAPATFHARQL